MTYKIRKGYPPEKPNVQPTFLKDVEVYVCPFCSSELVRVDAKRRPDECGQCGQAIRY